MNREKECVEFLPGLELTFPRACPWMTWPSAGQRQRIYPCPQVLQRLGTRGRPRLCIPAASEADGFALDPQADGHPRPRGLLALHSPLRIQPAQLVSARLGPAGLHQLVIWL